MVFDPHRNGPRRIRAEEEHGMGNIEWILPNRNHHAHQSPRFRRRESKIPRKRRSAATMIANPTARRAARARTTWPICSALKLYSKTSGREFGRYRGQRGKLCKRKCKESNQWIRGLQCL